METQRLHKILAARGVASRRACEKLIAEGRVMVDGQVVTDVPTTVSPDADIRVDGVAVREPRKAYFILNKPGGYVTSMHDDRGRMDIGKLVKRLRTRVYPVGRLDIDTEGLLLLTNDGALTNVLTHPRFKVEKTYRLTVRGRMDSEAVNRLRTGVYLKEGKASARVRVLRTTRESTRLEMVISQGFNRQIRRMCAAVGHEVKRLQRVRFGPLSSRGLSRGEFRALKKEEIAALQKLAKESAGQGGSREVKRGRSGRPK